MGLKKYNQKRDFKKTPEPPGKLKKNSGKKLAFVIQKHHARRLHYDFRLEFGGTLKSWAVPKGPSFNPADRRLAVEVEDHPIAYGGFEGEIPKGEYGAGQVIVWDNGTWSPVAANGTPLSTAEVTAALKKGHLDFELDGHKLRGGWSLIRMGSASEKNNWLLLKRRDAEARTDYDVTVEEPDSVLRRKRRPKAAGAPARERTGAKPLKARTAGKRVKKKSARGLEAPPDFVKPQLAQLVDRVPDGTQWLHEIKFDGYRTLCRINGEDVRFVTRNNHDWTSKYKQLLPAAQELGVQNAVLDGEIVCLNEQGHSDFQKLQNSLAGDSPARLYYYIFDLLFLDGEDLREFSLLERKKKLAALLKPLKKSPFLFSEHWQAQGAEMYRESCRLKLEGVVSKDAQAPYLSGRSALWQKTKCSLRQEFVIGGYTESAAEGRPFAALLLGVFDDDGKFRYTGRTGTGFTAASFTELAPRLRKLERDDSPFDVNSPRGRTLHWVKPELVAEVEFKAWTQDKVLRMASFQGLRQDKRIQEVHVEKPAKKSARASAGKSRGTAGRRKADATEIPPAGNELVAGVKITHPDRVVYPETGTCKLDVVRYYETVAPWMLPYLRGRPVSILRCQETTAAGCYFQKHAEGRNLVGIGSKPVHYKDKRDTALIIENSEDIIQLAQAGTIEIHGWNGQFRHITKPDQIVFDLDPENAKLWGRVVDTALEIRRLLRQLKLESFLKVTGGKGLHIQVPIEPRYSWDTIKSFSKSLMNVLVQQNPDHYTTNMTKANRGGKIFLDYLRNGYGATAVIPYSLRARAQPTVALPISWRDLKKSLSPDDFRYDDVLKLLKRRGEPGGRQDPWARYFDSARPITVLEGNQRRDTEAWPRI